MATGIEKCGVLSLNLNVRFLLSLNIRSVNLNMLPTLRHENVHLLRPSPPISISLRAANLGRRASFLEVLDGDWECACDYFRNGNVIFVPMRLRGDRGNPSLKWASDQSFVFLETFRLCDSIISCLFVLVLLISHNVWSHLRKCRSCARHGG